jgi:hypothetical protein
MLLDRAAIIRTGKVVPGRPEDSLLFQRVTGAVAPIMPAGGAKLADDDIATIRRWIDEGAPDWAVPLPLSRPFISNDDVISAIEEDLSSIDSNTTRKFTRYFVLTNLHNAGDTKLNTYRAALFKLLNSLSWDKDIVRPVVIDRQETIVRIDLRDYGWTDPASTWETILAGYPYGVEFPGSGYARIQIQTSSPIPFIRADWFLSAASMPPLYHDILELPDNEADLESCGNRSVRCLHIETARNLQDAPGVRVVRAGFTESGVSNSNRIVERHRSPYGAYWKSHDFPDNIGEHNIFQNPLDFRRAGGEIIFNLPNGLQAYLLVNEKGSRIDQAPTNIVFDKGGSRAEIRNGLSCMSCHVNGMRSFTDDVRATLSALPFDISSYASALYVDNASMKKLLDEDQARFQSAVEKTGVKPGTEPIVELSERYGRSIDAITAARELELTPDQFVKRLAASPALLQSGLTTLTAGGTVKRDTWEDAFGLAIEDLGLGVYVPPSRAYGERFFTGSPLRSFAARAGGQTVNDLVPTIIRGFLGRTVRSLENGRHKTYNVRDIRISSDCSAEIADANRLDDPLDPRQWWLEEYVQSFSLRAVHASITSSGNVRQVAIRAVAPGSIRLERTSSNENRWNDPSLPPTGRRTEFPDLVQFELPQDADTEKAFESLRRAIDICSRRG